MKQKQKSEGGLFWSLIFGAKNQLYGLEFYKKKSILWMKVNFKKVGRPTWGSNPRPWD